MVQLGKSWQILENNAINSVEHKHPLSSSHDLTRTILDAYISLPTMAFETCTKQAGSGLNAFQSRYS